MMMTLQTLKMDMNKTLIFVFLMVCVNCVSGLAVSPPENLVVDILDGEVTVRWNKPVNTSASVLYNVQMANYSGQWVKVPSCTGITNTYCDLSSLVYSYRMGYKVKVELVAGDAVAMTPPRKFLPSTSKLLPPSFTLWPTSSTLTVCVDQKPILRKLFPYGSVYTIYLEEKGQANKNTTAYLKDYAEDDQKTKTFSSLRWGTEYCVSMKVEGMGEILASKVSPKQCVRLPQQEWFTIAVSSLSILCVLVFAAITATILICYLRRPGKTPAALKTPISGWLPLSVGEGTMEVVTDKGWFLSSHRAEVKNCVKIPVTHVTVTENNDEEDRRTSMDSGVSMESNSTTNNGGSPPMRQEDSGCGSLGGPESSTSSQTDYPLQEERTDTNIVRKREDSGLGLGGQDSGSLKEAVAGSSYRSQSPSAVQIHACDDNEAFKQILPDTVLAEVVTGYRAGPQSCICSGAGQCTWCHQQAVYGTGLIKQYKSMCIDSGLLNSKCDFVDSYKGVLTFPSYFKKMHMDIVMVDGFETSSKPAEETFPLLTALSPLPLVVGGQDFNMNNVPLSLCDVQLTGD